MISAQLVKELREKTGAGILDSKKALEETNGDIAKAIDYLRENGIAKAAKKDGRVAAEGLTKVVVDNDTAVIFEVNSETDFVAKNDSFLSLLDTVAKYILESNSDDLETVLNYEIDGESLERVLVTATATIGEKITLRRFTKITKESNQVFGSYIHMGGKISVLSVFEGSDTETANKIAMHIAAVNPQFLNKESVDQDVVEKERQTLRKEALNEGKPENIVDKMVEGRLGKFLEEIALTEQSYVVDPDKKVKEVLSSSNLKELSLIRYEVGEGIEKQEVDFAAEVAAQANL